MNTIWYSFQGGKPGGDEKGFYEESDFSWTETIKAELPQIKEEIINLVKKERENLPLYFNRSLTEKGTRWKTFSFAFWNLQFRKNQKRCPYTVSILKKIPGIVSCSISVLEPGSRIKPHRGDTNAIIRCHVPITIPGSLPESGFKVAGETREWKDGHLLLFNDSAEHEAWNLSSSERIILILDMIRPEFISHTRTICSNVLGGLALQYITSPKPLKFIYRTRGIRLRVQKLIAGMIRVMI